MFPGRLYFAILYLIIGLLLILWISQRRERSREREILHFLGIFVDLNPVVVVAGVALWPLWLLLLLLPERMFQGLPEHRNDPPHPPPLPTAPPSTLHRRGVVIIPLHPAGRIRVDNRLYDARTDFGRIEADVEVEVLGQSISGELRVRAVTVDQ